MKITFLLIAGLLSFNAASAAGLFDSLNKVLDKTQQTVNDAQATTDKANAIANQATQTADQAKAIGKNDGQGPVNTPAAAPVAQETKTNLDASARRTTQPAAATTISAYFTKNCQAANAGAAAAGFPGVDCSVCAQALNQKQPSSYQALSVGDVSPAVFNTLSSEHCRGK
ncbi:MAG: hypothetical protein QM808_00890 [Steroidobacteraceae bacterium]